MLLEEQEMREMFISWLGHQPSQENEDDFIPFLQYQTQGHVGMLERLLEAIGRDAKGDLVQFRTKTASYAMTNNVSKLTAEKRRSFVWNGRNCQYLMEKGEFYKHTTHLRGVLRKQEEASIVRALRIHAQAGTKFKDLRFSDIRDTLKKVAMSLDGLVSPTTEHEAPDPALEFVHRNGLLHSQRESGQTVYRFPSRCHRQ